MTFGTAVVGLLGAFISKGGKEGEKTSSISEQRKGLGIAQALSILRPMVITGGPKSVQMTLRDDALCIVFQKISLQKSSSSKNTVVENSTKKSHRVKRKKRDF